VGLGSALARGALHLLVTVHQSNYKSPGHWVASIGSQPDSEEGGVSVSRQSLGAVVSHLSTL
jgi:hypothetical protein